MSWKYLKPSNNMMPELCAVMTFKWGVFFHHSKEVNKAGWFWTHYAAFFLANCRKEELGPDNVLLSESHIFINSSHCLGVPYP